MDVMMAGRSWIVRYLWFPQGSYRLIAEENGLTIDENAFEAALSEQKERSRKRCQKEKTGDWEVLLDDKQIVFVGYDQLTFEGARAVKYRTLKQKMKDLPVGSDKTPFTQKAVASGGWHRLFKHWRWNGEGDRYQKRKWPYHTFCGIAFLKPLVKPLLQWLMKAGEEP